MKPLTYRQQLHRTNRVKKHMEAAYDSGNMVRGRWLKQVYNRMRLKLDDRLTANSTPRNPFKKDTGNR